MHTSGRAQHWEAMKEEHWQQDALCFSDSFDLQKNLPCANDILLQVVDVLQRAHQEDDTRS